MSTETPPERSATAPSRRPAWTSRLAGRGTLIVAALVLALAVYITVGLFTMEVPESAQPPGPQFYPALLAIGAYLLVALLVIQTLRHPEPVEPATTMAEHTMADQDEENGSAAGSAADVATDVTTSEDAETGAAAGAETGTTEDSVPAAAGGSTAAGPARAGDLKALALAVVAFLAFTAILEPVGWIISAGLMFWGVSWALGSKRTVLDLGIGIVVASAVQVAFSLGLGLNLPAGILGGMF